MELLQRLYLKLDARDELTLGDRQALAGAAGEVELFESGQMVVEEGVPQTVSRLLVEGVAARTKLMDDGRQQITELHLAGDFVDLHSFLLKRLDHDVVALSACRLVTFEHSDLQRITETEPHLTRMLWLSTLLDGATHRAWLVSTGRRTAVEQVANLFCEWLLRSRVVDLAEGSSCHLPLTQQQLADACGLTSVHVNRVVQELRADALIEWRGGRLTVLNLERLAELARFDPAYLVLHKEPR